MTRGGAGSGVAGHLDKEGALQRLSQVIITAEQSELLRGGPLPSQHVGFLQHLQLLPEIDTEPPQAVTTVTEECSTKTNCCVWHVALLFQHLRDRCQSGNAAHQTVLIKRKSNGDLKEMLRSCWFSELQYKSKIFFYFCTDDSAIQITHYNTKALSATTKRMTDQYDGSLYWPIHQWLSAILASEAAADKQACQTSMRIGLQVFCVNHWYQPQWGGEDSTRRLPAT